MWPYHSPSLQNVIFIGDAAHSMSPVLGQGVNLALQDANLLTECLEANATVPQALEDFSNQRKRVLFFYQSVSRWTNPWFQSSYIPGFAITRDLFFAPFSNASKHIKNELLLTLAGAKKSFMPFGETFDYQFWNHK